MIIPVGMDWTGTEEQAPFSDSVINVTTAPKIFRAFDPSRAIMCESSSIEVVVRHGADRDGFCQSLFGPRTLTLWRVFCCH